MKHINKHKKPSRVSNFFIAFSVTWNLWPVTCNLWPVTCDLRFVPAAQTSESSEKKSTWSLHTSYSTYNSLDIIGSFDFLSKLGLPIIYSRLFWKRRMKTVTSSRSRKCHKPWSRSLKRKESVKTCDLLTLPDRLTVLNQHLKVWIEWVPLIPWICSV